jgi:hypothetical protein
MLNTVINLCLQMVHQMYSTFLLSLLVDLTLLTGMTHFPFLKNLSCVHYWAPNLSILDSHEATPAIMTHVTMAEHIKST